jgi:hypothetical protein
LQPGEWVAVKTKEEILATLDARGRNRGLTFEAEMLPYCGKCFRVLRRVERIIEEASGRMIQLSNSAIILEDVICASRYRRYCARASYMYWREIWLRRVDSELECNDCVSSDDPCAVFERQTMQDSAGCVQQSLAVVACSDQHACEYGSTPGSSAMENGS